MITVLQFSSAWRLRYHLILQRLNLASPKVHRFGACSFLPVVAVGAAGAIEGLAVVFPKIAVHVYGLFQKESLRWLISTKLEECSARSQAGEKDWKD
jgi:hypothetical protein